MRFCQEKQVPPVWWGPRALMAWDGSSIWKGRCSVNRNWYNTVGL